MADAVANTYRVKWRHSKLWSHYDFHIGGNTAYCVKLSGEDLSRYSNNWISWSKKMTVSSLSYYESYVTITNISQSLPTSWRENSWHGYGLKKFRHCHPIHTYYNGYDVDVYGRCSFFLSFFLSFFFFIFPRLFWAVADWMSIILPYMMWP